MRVPRSAAVEGALGWERRDKTQRAQYDDAGTISILPYTIGIQADTQ